MSTLIHTFQKTVEESVVIKLPYYTIIKGNLIKIDVCETITSVYVACGWYSMVQIAPGVAEYNHLKALALRGEPIGPERFNEAIEIVRSSLPDTNPSTNKS